MNFGKTFTNPHEPLLLPEVIEDNVELLNALSSNQSFQIHSGTTAWSKASLKNFFPRGEKNPIRYYSEKFDAVELNAFYYRIFPRDMIYRWVENTVEDFHFYPKVPRMLSGVDNFMKYERRWEDCLLAFRAFGNKLGGCLLQLSPSFGIEKMKGLEQFLLFWPEDLPLAIEFRNKALFQSDQALSDIRQLLSDHGIVWVITDTPGRRDVLHMRLTANRAFIRFNALEDPGIDEARIDDWVNRLRLWQEAGLEHVAFFMHEHTENDGPKNTFYFENKSMIWN
ncbi:MAG TPA: DUF72 domain-containing protein [Saprospiraceae bacterium]|nr:DUF72 domain-containing protein [Saprospiraceae bacterium]